MDGLEGIQFAWKNGPFLKALQSGDWIVLDEVRLQGSIISLLLFVQVYNIMYVYVCLPLDELGITVCS